MRTRSRRCARAITRATQSLQATTVEEKKDEENGDEEEGEDEEKEDERSGVVESIEQTNPIHNSNSISNV